MEHHALRLRFIPEIRNGDNNFLEGLKGGELPRFVNIDPLKMEDAVNEAIRRVLPKTIDRISALIPDKQEAPHHD